MTLNSPIGNYPFPALADVPNAQTFGQQLTSALDLTTVPRFASDAAVAAAIPSPTTGQCIMRTDIGYGVLMHWGHSRWIAETSLISELTNVTTDFSFTSIPQYWSSLRIIGTGFRTSSALTSYNAAVQFNGDTAGNYTWVCDSMAYNTSPVLNTGTVSAGTTSWGTSFIAVGANQDGNGGGHCILEIPGYSLSGPKHSGYSTNMWERAAGLVTQRSFLAWQGTAAITSISFAWGGNPISTGNSVRLYGIS